MKKSVTYSAIGTHFFHLVLLPLLDLFERLRVIGHHAFFTLTHALVYSFQILADDVKKHSERIPI